jgi:hypothetical protein
MPKSCNYLFKPGMLTTVMDGQFGSSGKGKIASYIGENADNWSFACNSFSAQAGHWVKLDDGRCYFYQQLNSVAYQPEFSPGWADRPGRKLYIGPGSCIELPALLREIEENHIVPGSLGIHPKATIILPVDEEFERGTGGFDGAPLPEGSPLGTAKFGSTCHGVGSAVARKVLRRPSVLTVDKVEDLAPYLCDVAAEITRRLEKGESGLLELAQGYPLSLNGPFFPYCTSRNVTVAQALSDLFLAPKYAGPLIINLRTLPIRINSKKYIGKDGKHLTWDEIQDGVPHEVYEGNSGHWYPDQYELSWEEVTKSSGSPDPIIEMTSVTKLPRRIATFSRMNLEEAIRYNQSREDTYLSLNFVNYIDYGMTGKRDVKDISPKFLSWVGQNLGDLKRKVAFLGTGPLTDDLIDVHESF